MSDIEEIRALVHRYADAVCRRDTATWSATWDDDAVWDIGRGPVLGRAAITDAYATAMGLFEAVVQLAHNGTAVIDGEQATGRWYMSEHARTRSGRTVFYLGAYDDVYRRTALGWRFARRALTWYYQGGPSLDGTFGPPPGYALAD